MKRFALAAASLFLCAAVCAAGCGDSPAPQCPPCQAPSTCDVRTGVCVGFRTPLLDAAAQFDASPDARADAGP
jgi:hypothetical protein